jgi:hypothetical protein
VLAGDRPAADNKYRRQKNGETVAEINRQQHFAAVTSAAAAAAVGVTNEITKRTNRRNDVWSWPRQFKTVVSRRVASHRVVSCLAKRFARQRFRCRHTRRHNRSAVGRSLLASFVYPVRRVLLHVADTRTDRIQFQNHREHSATTQYVAWFTADLNRV